MKKFQLLFFIILLSVGYTQAQSLEELKSMKSDKEASIADLQGQINAIQGEVDGISKDIDLLTGWRKGLSGIIGFDWNKSNGWIASPNPDASSSALNIGINAYALQDKAKTFWHNKGFVTKSWQDVDLSSGDAGADDDGLFDNGTVDILNISSLGGYKLTDKFALSGLGELNTSIENFLSPGTLDIGVGATWLPIQNMTVVVHPLNYHVAFSGLDNLDSQGSIGAKVRVDYFQDFNVGGKAVKWSTTLTSFMPYSNDKTIVELDPTDPTNTFEAGLFEYTWLNTLSFELWKGIGVGLGWGIRNSQFESTDTQSYTSIGLSYGF